MLDLKLQHYEANGAREIAHELASLYVAAYRGTPQEHDPFYSGGRFAERFKGYTRSPGFELVTAHHGSGLVGYIFGYVLPANTQWWDGLLSHVPREFTTETGSRTFAINELHVGLPSRGQHVATQLHDELATHRPESRATILVRLDNPAQATYLHWGYKLVGQLKPFEDSPTYNALLLDHLAQSEA